MTQHLEQTQTTTPLDHDLNRHFDRLASYSSTPALLASDDYVAVKPQIEAVLNAIAVGTDGTDPASNKDSVRAAAWNIERGRKLEGILRALSTHERLRNADVLLLTELDIGMARSGNVDVPRVIATHCRLNYAFAPSYINLQKGSGLEIQTSDENRQALHGNAIFSTHPLTDVRSISLPNGKDKMKGKEKRLGSQRAVIATVHHPAGPFRAASVHLDAHSTQKHRMRQLEMVLDEVDRLSPRLPTIVGGDWNTSTHNSSRAVYSILGYFRRLLMGPRYVLANHYLHPERYFERHLFGMLNQRGYDFRNLNMIGKRTLDYDILDLAQNSGLADWIPKWCFWWIEMALKGHEGKCGMKLDWFTGRGLKPRPGSAEVLYLQPSFGKLSDHEPIAVDFSL